jgi:hypothetical protein
VIPVDADHPEQVPGCCGDAPDQAPGTAWECARCDIPLRSGTVKVSYLGTEQPVALWRCPQCGTVLIPEELALGRMAEIEQLLEDK